MIRNRKLKECLQLLAQSTLPFYKENNLPIDKKYPNYQLGVDIFLDELDKKVVENPDFGKCISLMKNDQRIKALQGKLVGTNLGASIVENEEICILSFLRQLYCKKQEYEQDLFDQEYLSFEDLFYSDMLYKRDSATVYNFKSSLEKIEFGDGIVIKKASGLDKPQDDYLERIYSTYPMHCHSDFVLERVYSKKKVIFDTETKADMIKAEEEFVETPTLFDLVITSLRILKSSGVFRDHRINRELLSFHPHGMRTTSSPLFTNMALGKQCEIEETDITELKNIFIFLRNEKQSRFVVAHRRLFFGVGRQELSDRLIDYMIGLEALYLPNESQELSYRLSSRVAFLLHSDTNERKGTYHFVKNMYKARSDIVHGTKYRPSLKEDEISRLEEILRESIKLWISDKSNFDVDKLDNLFFY